jgi:hypothetical protein
LIEFAPLRELRRYAHYLMFQFEEMKVSDFGPCECCGDLSRHASGMVRRDGDPYAIYQVDWTTQQVARHGAEFYLLLGHFGEGTTPADKFAVALHFFVEPDRFGFMVVNADETRIASHPLVGRALRREEVVGTPLAQEVFDLVDAIWLEDGNIAEVTNSVTPTCA